MCGVERLLLRVEGCDGGGEVELGFEGGAAHDALVEHDVDGTANRTSGKVEQ